MPSRLQTFDSNGPEGRVRGNAHQIYEKYLALARDATSAGDRILAEGFYQFAEHYYRVVSDSTDPERRFPQQAQPGQPGQQDQQGQPGQSGQQGHQGQPGQGQHPQQPQQARRDGVAESNDEQPPTPEEWPGAVPPKPAQAGGGNGAAELAPVVPAVAQSAGGDADGGQSAGDGEQKPPRRRGRRPRQQEAAADDAPADEPKPAKGAKPEKETAAS